MESDSSLGWQGKGALEELMRERIRTTIEGIIDEELVAALGAARSQRSGPVRVGYRHGKRSRTLTTSLGPTTIAMPRARLEGEDGRRREWRSAMIPRWISRSYRSRFVGGVVVDDDQLDVVRGLSGQRVEASGKCRRCIAGGNYHGDSRRR